MPSASGQTVDIEHAPDAEFQAWIASQGIPVDDEGIAEWAFNDRVGVINHALAHGVNLKFSEENTSENTSESEVFEDDNPASEAG